MRKNINSEIISIPEKNKEINKEIKKEINKKHSSNFSKRISRYVVVLLLALLAILLYSSYDVLGENYRSSYAASKEDEYNSTYNRYYTNSYNWAESKTHVANDISIIIGNVREVSRLEVLRVNDKEYVIDNADDNKEKIISWLEVSGTGVFTVDLSVGEYIIDDQRQYVLVRVPRPILTEFSLDSVESKFWRNDIFNDSISKGEKLALEQRKEGEVRIKENIMSDRRFNDKAKQSAESMIIALVKQFSPNIDDLVVEVEFIDEL